MPCLIETTIRLLPEVLTSAASAEQILQVEKSNRELLSIEETMHYLDFPPSYAVDGKSDTAFRSPESAKRGDLVSMDMLHDISHRWKDIEMAFLVDSATEFILGRSSFEIFTSTAWVLILAGLGHKYFN